MSHQLSTNVAANVVRIRKARRISQSELVEQLQQAGSGINRSILANLETGRRAVISVDELAAFAAVLGLDAWSLTGEAPYCAKCNGEPPAGFICATCGEGGAS